MNTQRADVAQHTTRVVNPARDERHRVRVINPFSAADLLLHGPAALLSWAELRKGSKRRNPDAETEAAVKVFEDFQGRAMKSMHEHEARPGTPGTVAQLGDLVELNVTPTSYFARMFPGSRIGDPRVLSYEPGEALLCADANERLHIVGACRLQMPIGFRAAHSYPLGSVNSVAYGTTKAHMEGKPETYEHEFAEHGVGKRPMLCIRDGWLFLVGGTYKVKGAGIVG
jgi:hypothetical protein